MRYFTSVVFLGVFSFFCLTSLISAKHSTQKTNDKWPSAGYVIHVPKETLRGTFDACYNQKTYMAANKCNGGQCGDPLNICTCYGVTDFPDISQDDQNAFSWRSIWENVPPVDQNGTMACWAISAATVTDAARCIQKNGRFCKLDKSDVLSVSDVCACSVKMVKNDSCMSRECSAYRLGCAPVSANGGGGFVTIGLGSIYKNSILPEAFQPTKYDDLLDKNPCLDAGKQRPRSECGDIDVNLSAELSPEERLQRAVYKAPVAVTINFSESLWSDYNGEIFDKECDPFYLTHVVVVTGWGEKKGVKYWELRNSMGPKWGDGGYFYIKRDTGGFGLCGIAFAPTMSWRLRGD